MTKPGNTSSLSTRPRRLQRRVSSGRSCWWKSCSPRWPPAGRNRWSPSGWSRWPESEASPHQPRGRSLMTAVRFRWPPLLAGHQVCQLALVFFVALVLMSQSQGSSVLRSDAIPDQCHQSLLKTKNDIATIPVLGGKKFCV